MVDGDVESAKAVTHTRIAVPGEDGSVTFKHVLESLDSPQTPQIRQIPSQDKPVRDAMDNDYIDHMLPPDSPRPSRSRVCIFFQYIFSFDFEKTCNNYRPRKITFLSMYHVWIACWRLTKVGRHRVRKTNCVGIVIKASWLCGDVRIVQWGV